MVIFVKSEISGTASCIMGNTVYGSAKDLLEVKKAYGNCGLKFSIVNWDTFVVFGALDKDIKMEFDLYISNTASDKQDYVLLTSCTSLFDIYCALSDRIASTIEENQKLKLRVRELEDKQIELKRVINM